MKRNFLFTIVSILTFISMLLGASLAYFTASSKSQKGIDVNASNLAMYLEVLPLYTGIPLIPTNDDDIYIAYNSKCQDLNKNGACQAYTIDMANIGDAQSFVGTITFELNEIENLKYLILDENNNVYVDKTEVISDSPQSLGNSFELDSGFSKMFRLIIWVPNLDKPQNNEDAGGSFEATVTYTSSLGSQITGTIAGVN